MRNHFLFFLLLLLTSVVVDAVVHRIPLKKRKAKLQTKTGLKNEAGIHRNDIGTSEGLRDLTSNYIMQRHRKVTERVAEQHPMFARKKERQEKQDASNSVGIENMYNIDRNTFYGYLSIGTPNSEKRQLYVDFNTGLDALWVISKKCHFWKMGCWSKHLYDHSKSSTYESDGRTVSVDTNFVGNVSGFISRDVIHIAGFDIKNQSFIEVTDVPKEFYFEKMDGSFGLGFPATTPEQGPFFNLMDDDALDEGMFSFYFSPAPNDYRSVFVMGGVDAIYMKSQPLWSPLKYSDAWVTDFNGFIVDNKKIFKYDETLDAVFDTGFKNIVGPTEEVTALLKAIGGFSNLCDDVGYLPASITLSLQGEDGKPLLLEIHQKNLYTQISQDTCKINFEMADIPYWIIGETIITEYYTIFDYDNLRMGFALK